MWGYTNPVIDSNNPDPAALALPGGGYLAVATSNYATNSAAEDAFPIYHSADLVDWELRGHVFPAGAWPAYCDRNMWAPEIHRVNGRCGPVPAPSPRTATVSVQVPGLLLLQRPQQPPLGGRGRGGGGSLRLVRGPAGGAAHLPQRGAAQQPGSTDTECGHHVQDSIAGPIDQHYFKDPLSGKDYLIWKTDELVLPFNPSVVYIQELAESGTAFAEGSVKTKILQTDRLMFQLLRNYSAMTEP